MSGLLARGKKTPQTKLGFSLRKLATTEREAGRDDKALQCERAAADLDMAALSLGVKGDRIKTLGAYYKAAGVYRIVAGEAYEG